MLKWVGNQYGHLLRSDYIYFLSVEKFIKNKQKKQ